MIGFESQIDKIKRGRYNNFEFDKKNLTTTDVHKSDPIEKFTVKQLFLKSSFSAIFSFCQTVLFNMIIMFL